LQREAQTDHVNDAPSAEVDGSDELAIAIGDLTKPHSGLAARLRTLEHSVVSSHGGVTVRAHYLAFRDGNPTLSDFVQVLSEKLMHFCIPGSEFLELREKRHTLTEAEYEERVGELRARAQRLFIKTQKSTHRNGEAGELILYLLIEWVLAAPQLLAKMRLKTNPNMPVHGADGIHVHYDREADKLILYWGEAKVHARLSTALDAVEKSIWTFVEGDGLVYEIDLLKAHSQLTGLRDAAREKLLNFLDPYSEQSNERICVFACLIAFDFKGFSETTPRDEREAEFTNALIAKLDEAVRELDEKLTEKGLSDRRIELFFLPMETVELLRTRFRQMIGWADDS
jgi:hypothetical protein